MDPKVTMKPHSGTLVVDISGEKAESYEGVYQCTARNDHGTAMSNNIIVRQSSKKHRPFCLELVDCFIISSISHIILFISPLS